MKKTFITMLLLLTLMLCMTSNVSAASYSGSCGYDLKWTLNTDTGVLYISGSGDMIDYKQSGAPWYSYRNNITSVVVDSGCTRIGSWAFGFLEKLTTAKLPNTVTTLGEDAFRNCTKLVSCPLPDYLTEIGQDAFWSCVSMKGLDLPATLESIGQRAFLNCESITTAHIPGGVTTLYYGTFAECNKLATVTLGEGVTNISEGVFKESALLTINLPSTINKIGLNAFKDCKSLQVVTMMGCEVIGQSAFSGCSSLRKLTLAPNTKELGHSCFAYCNALTSVRIPKSVTKISYGAFYWHKNSGYPALEQVVILNPDCEINDYAYLGREGICTIYGEYGSTAHDYAITQGYNFELLGNEKPEPSIFKDVSSSAYYAKPVEWAVNNGITAGITPVTFEPETICTRGQVVTFLWRAAGKPAPTTKTCTFKDVQKDAYYYNAVLWAVENDITSGINAATFAPNATCTRDQVVTFLWRAMGKQEPTSTRCTFTDINVNGFYYKAMLWAVENKITAGISPTKFSPNGSCTRCQVVSFLYRTYN